MSISKPRQIAFRVFLIVFFAAWGLPAIWVLTYKWINPPITFLQIREGVNCPEGISFSKDWVSFGRISKHMQLAVVSSEDQNYMKHRGLDFSAISKAEAFNAKNSKKKRGASTVTQQVAKNVFLWPNRSFIRKAAEVYFASLIELLWSKQRIMEVYLNVIETGPCTFGVEAASQRYFKKTAAEMSREQCAMLTAAIPSPRKSNPAKPSAFMAGRQQHVLRQMRMLGDSYFDRYRKPVPPKDTMKSKKKKKAS